MAIIDLNTITHDDMVLLIIARDYVRITGQSPKDFGKELYSSASDFVSSIQDDLEDLFISPDE